MDTAYYIIDTSSTILLSHTYFSHFTTIFHIDICRVNRHRFSVVHYLRIDIPLLNVSFFPE